MTGSDPDSNPTPPQGPPTMSVAEILEKLASFTKEPEQPTDGPIVAQNAQSPNPPPPPSNVPTASSLPSRETIETHLAALQTIIDGAASQRPPVPEDQASYYGSAPTAPHNPSPPSVSDVSEILEWAPAMRWVSDLGKDPGFGEEIKKLIRQQKDEEDRWFAARCALRRALYGQDNTLTPETVELHPQLRTFDEKVYCILEDVCVEMRQQLKALGVPFFRVSEDLVISGESAGAETGLGENGGGQGGKKEKITEEELSALQKRMLEYLEAMYWDGL